MRRITILPSLVAFPELTYRHADSRGPGWLYPKVGDKVNGTTVIYVKKPMAPVLSGGGAVDGSLAKAYQIHEKMPNILVIPEQFQIDKDDYPGVMLDSEAKRQKYLDDVTEVMKVLYEAEDTARPVLELGNDIGYISPTPSEDYNPRQGHFQVSDEHGLPTVSRGNVIIMGSSERQRNRSHPTYDCALPRTLRGGWARSGEGTGGILCFDPEMSFRTGGGQFMQPFTIFIHEFLHCIQRLLALDDPLERKYSLPFLCGPNKGMRSKRVISKLEIDITSMQDRIDSNGGIIVKEVGIVKDVLEGSIHYHWRRAKDEGNISAARYQAFVEALSQRKKHLESKAGHITEDLVTVDVEARYNKNNGSNAQFGKRRNYIDNLQGWYKKKNSRVIPLDSDWIDVNREQPGCSIQYAA